MLHIISVISPALITHASFFTSRVIFRKAPLYWMSMAVETKRNEIRTRIGAVLALEDDILALSEVRCGAPLQRAYSAQLGPKYHTVWGAPVQTGKRGLLAGGVAICVNRSWPAPLELTFAPGTDCARAHAQGRLSILRNQRQDHHL